MQKVRFWDPDHWRFRAEETRTVADQMAHEEARTIMRRIANDYDRLAKVAEEQLADLRKEERLAIDAAACISSRARVSSTIPGCARDANIMARRKPRRISRKRAVRFCCNPPPRRSVRSTARMQRRSGFFT